MIPNHAVNITLKVHGMGHYVLSVASFGGGPPCAARAPKLAASYFEWALLDERPDLLDGG